MSCKFVSSQVHMIIHCVGDLSECNVTPECTRLVLIAICTTADHASMVHRSCHSAVKYIHYGTQDAINDNIHCKMESQPTVLALQCLYNFLINAQGAQTR